MIVSDLAMALQDQDNQHACRNGRSSRGTSLPELSKISAQDFGLDARALSKPKIGLRWRWSGGEREEQHIGNGLHEVAEEQDYVSARTMAKRN